ncbi:MAG: DUF1572 family protein [Parafilimonas sp.]
MNIEEAFLQSAIKKFKAQKTLGEKTFAQLNDKDFVFKPSEESNSIALIIQHMRGNMLSRWTNFLTKDGEKPWRERDKEFEDILSAKQDILNAWNSGWSCVLDVLDNLKTEDLLKTITIRNEPLLVVDAIVRQIDHYGYHVGQIVYIAKIIKGADWQTLSIAKNISNDFNKSINHA